MAGGVERFSVDPASLNSYEDALQWLSSQGLPVAKRADKQTARFICWLYRRRQSGFAVHE